jgi:hypothetical protein
MSFEHFHEEKDVLNLSDVDSFDFSQDDINTAMIGHIPDLVNNAREAARDLAYSYRGLTVGASAIAFDTSKFTPRIGIYTAGNYKEKIIDDYDPEHDVDSIPKFCSEMEVIRAADADEMQRIGIIVVAGTTRKDLIKDITGVESATLHPCVDYEDGKDSCLSVMSQNHLIDKQTIIFTVGKGTNIFQVQTFGEYSKRYSPESKKDFEDAAVYEYRSLGLAGSGVSEYDHLVASRGAAGSETSGRRKKVLLRRKLAYQAIKNMAVEL